MKFEGDSQRTGTIIDGFTDLWFGEAEKGEGVANRTTMIVDKSFAPSSVEELG